LNFNQINLQIDTATQSVTMTPKDNSTVYQQNSVAVANMNVTSVASLSYTYPTLTQSRLSTGNPVFTYRGKTVTATYTISEGGNVAPLAFNTSTGVLTLTANKQFNGGIYNITGSFTDTNGDGLTYTASFAVCVQSNTVVESIGGSITQSITDNIDTFAVKFTYNGVDRKFSQPVDITKTHKNA
jgi:hypothetical protein